VPDARKKEESLGTCVRLDTTVHSRGVIQREGGTTAAYRKEGDPCKGGPFTSKGNALYALRGDANEKGGGAEEERDIGCLLPNEKRRGRAFERSKKRRSSKRSIKTDFSFWGTTAE